MAQELAVSWISDFPAGARVSLAQQADGILTAAALDRDGTLQVCWVEGIGAWHGPLAIGPAVLEPGSAVALAKQNEDTLVAVAIDPHGTLHIAWVDGTGRWQGPVPVGGAVLHPRSGIALVKQDDDTLTAVAVDPWGTLHIAWVDGTGTWQGPVPVGGQVLQPGSGVAVAKQDDDTLTAVAIDRYGTLFVAWVDGTGMWQGPVPVGGQVLDPGSGIALARQDDDTLTAVAVSRDGTLQVAWVQSGGNWQGPVPVGGAVLEAGSQIALAKQTDATLTAVAISPDGTPHVAWVPAGGGDWQGPVPFGPAALDPRSGVALARQSDEIFTAVAIDVNGVPNVAWSDQGGDWQGPVPIHGPARRLGTVTGNYDPESLPHLRDSNDAGVAGTDLGFPVEHAQQLVFLFGDQFGRDDQRNLDPIGLTQARAPEPGGFALDWVTWPGDRSRFKPLVIAGLGDLLAFDTPTGGFSHNQRLWAFVNKGVPGTDPSDSQALLASTHALDADFELHHSVTYIKRDPRPARVPDSTVAHNRLNLAGAVVVSTADWPDLPAHAAEGLLIYGQGYDPWEAFLGYIDLPLDPPVVTNQLDAPPMQLQYFACYHKINRQRPTWDTNPVFAQGLFATPAVTFLSVTQVPGLPRWLAVYTECSPYPTPWSHDPPWNPDEHPGEQPPWQLPIVCRSAPTPWGPWSDPLPLVEPVYAYGRYLHNPSGGPQPLRFDPQDYPMDGFLYAPSVIERFTQYDEHARIVSIFYTLSTSKPYQVHLMRSDLRLLDWPDSHAGELWRTSREVRAASAGWAIQGD